MNSVAASRLPGALLAAALLAIGTGPAFAQTAAPGKPVATQKTAKPKSAAKPANAAQSDYWSVNYTVPSHFETQRARPSKVTPNAGSNVTVEQTSEFGRIPTQSGVGTVGFTTDTAVKRSEFYDGRAVPGMDPNTQKPSSFVGLSLNVASDNKAFPIPLPPSPWNRDE